MADQTSEVYLRACEETLLLYALSYARVSPLSLVGFRQVAMRDGAVKVLQETGTAMEPVTD